MTRRRPGRSRPDAGLRELVNTARAAGATAAKIISARDVVVDRRARLKCLVPICSSYGRRLLCPPNLMSFDEFSRILDEYENALLLQIEADVDSADRSSSRLTGDSCRRIESQTGVVDSELRLLDVVNEVEAHAFKMGYYFAAGLSASECRLCPECVPPSSGRTCRHPFVARPSMEAMGIDVIETCKRAGMPVRLSSKERVRFTGLVLVD